MGAQQTKERPRRAYQPKCDHELQINTSTSWIQENNLGTNSKGSGVTQITQLNQSGDQLLIALFDFIPPSTVENQSQIRVEKGDHLKLYGYSADGDWLDVECLRTNERGWIPTNYTGHIPVPPSDHFTTLNTGSTSGSSLTFQHVSSHDVSCNGSQGSLAGVGLESEKWYHGAIQRSYAEYLLNSGITGSFLIRESESHPGQLTISLRYEGQIWHYRIHRDDSNLYYVIESNKFTSVSDLVHHHEKHSDGLACTLLYPTPKRDRTDSELRMDPSFDVREIDRTEIVMKHKLGSGQYGVVYEAIWKPYNVLVAVKTLKENVTVRDEFLEEARLMKGLRHPNLVTLLGACTREPPYYIVTEFMCNGNLLDYLRTHPKTEMTPSVLLHMATQVARGMAYLEQHNFIHRDLAARNCLVGAQHTIKVADFGLARCIERDLTYRAHEGAKFPIKWTAPEGLVYNLFSTKSDVWAFGILLWEIATYGKTPYPGVELQDVYVLLERGTRMLCPEGCPEPVYELMLQCWQWLPEQRPPFSDILSQLESMQTNPTTLEDQIDNDLTAASLLSSNNEIKVINSNDTNKLFKRPPNLYPRPPLPPRPPPPRRSTSCDYLVDENEDNRCDKTKEDCKSDLGSDVPVNNNHKSHGNVFTKSYKNSLSKHLHIDDLSTDEFCTTEKDLSFTNSGSLGRRRTAPRPPRRTTPVKPLNFQVDFSSLEGNTNIVGSVYPNSHWDDIDHTPLPPPPPPIHLDSSHHQTHQSRSNQQQQYPRLPHPSNNGSLSNNSNSTPLTMPLVMSSSAIFPSSLSSYVDPIPLDNSLTRSICPDRLVSPTALPTSNKHIQPSSKSTATSKSGLNSDVSNKTNAVINHSHNKRNMDSNVPNESHSENNIGFKQSVHLSNVSSSVFQEELRDRLKQHSQQLKDSSAPKMTISKAVPNNACSTVVNSLLCNQEKSDLKPSVSNSPLFCTIPRLKPPPHSAINPPRTSSNNSPISSNNHVSIRGKVEPPRYPSELIRSLESTQIKNDSNSNSPVTTISKLPTNVSTTVSSNNSSRLHFKRCENEISDKLSDIIQKRLSWTGPIDDNLSTSNQKRSQRLCLPTIFSTSSTALDETTPSNSHNHCVPPTKSHLKKHLSIILEELERLIRLNDKSPRNITSSSSTANIPSSSTSNLEKLIELADQMEACRLSCSAYIDQATCSARAKFNFRDRFACLQTFSSLLRLKKLDSTCSNNNSKNNKKNINLLKDAENAIKEILNDLDKLTDDVVNTTTISSTTSSDSSNTSNFPGNKHNSNLASNQSTLTCTENINITDNRSATVFT
ncbi:Tyrosine-protein kinase ABL1 [Schistosoma japonicum]|nr:Tyrosine-protein kinase ABL1 [Schistosoma japonicum]